MSVLSEVRDWLARKYPKPSVDPEWTQAAVAWLQTELSLDPSAAHASEDLLNNVELQLLQSDLSDSMLHGTGLPAHLGSIKNGVIATAATGGGILVQVEELMEVGASAFSLMNVRQARKDGVDMSGLAVDDEDEGGEGAKEAKYPRGMLRFTLGDGNMRIKAIEYKRIPELVLGETPLGYKLLLKNVRIRNGTALLEPSSVELKGWQNEDMDANRDAEFVGTLRERMGKPREDPKDTEAPHASPPQPPREPPPRPAPDPQRAPAEPRTPTEEPLLELDPPRNPPPPTTDEDSQSFGDLDVDDGFWDELQYAEEQVQAQASTSTSTSTQPKPPTQLQPQTSSISTQPRPVKKPSAEIIEIDDDDEEDEFDGLDWGDGPVPAIERASTQPQTQPIARSSQATVRRPLDDEVIDLSD